MANNQLGSYLVRLRPRAGNLQVSRGRTVLVTDRNGFVCGQGGEGLFVHQALAMIQAMVGIYPYAPLDLLLVDPHFA